MKKSYCEPEIEIILLAGSIVTVESDTVGEGDEQDPFG